MTIQQLENRCGLDRTTIRFYERQGFLTPARLPNGYRDYSEEDALTLEKIILLRQLDLPLEDIRAVQRGQVPLALALEQQEEVLRCRQQSTAHGLELSRALRKAGECYSTLQPMKYKGQLPPAEKIAPAPPLQTAPSGIPAHGCHYRRAAARLLDHTLYYLLVCLVFCFVLRVPFDKDRLLIFGILAMPLVEPLLLCTLGWTPGKWLMGLRLRQMEPEQAKPTYGQALVRCLRVLWYGLGLCIPIYRVCRLYVSWKQGEKEEAQPWDAYDFTYTLADRSWFADLLCGGLLVLILAGCLGADERIYDASTLPFGGRQGLTAEQYAKKINDTLDYVFDENDVRQQPDGSYLFLEGHNRLLGSAQDFSRQFHQNITLEKGVVTTVTFRVSLEWPLEKGELYHWEDALIRPAIMALAGATSRQAQLLRADFSRREGGQATLNGWTIHMTPQQPVGEGAAYTVTICRSK